jgi:hypothetical protein
MAFGYHCKELQVSAKILASMMCFKSHIYWLKLQVCFSHKKKTKTHLPQFEILKLIIKLEQLNTLAWTNLVG